MKIFLIELKPQIFSDSDGRTYEHSELQKKLLKCHKKMPIYPNFIYLDTSVLIIYEYKYVIDIVVYIHSNFD